MEIQIKELIDSIREKHRVRGISEGFVRSARPIDLADEDSLCFCREKGDRALDMIRNSKARVVVCLDKLEFPEGENRDKTLILVANPRLTFCRLLASYFSDEKPEPAVHSTAIIDKEAVVGNKVYIGPNSYVGYCEIGDRTVIDGHVHIHDGTKIGRGVIIHAGVIIGAEALAFERNENGELERFPQISGVVIEDDVEIGANSVICRGSLSNTLIGKGTKLDVGVKVTHGVRIGRHCVVAAGTVICGSSKIGDQTWLGPQVCIREGVTVGNRAIVGAGSVVHKDVSDNSVVTGSPARPIPNAWSYKMNEE